MRIFRKTMGPARRLELAQIKNRITNRLSELYSWGSHDGVSSAILNRAIDQIVVFENQLLRVDKLLAI